MRISRVVLGLTTGLVAGGDTVLVRVRSRVVEGAVKWSFFRLGACRCLKSAEVVKTMFYTPDSELAVSRMSGSASSRIFKVQRVVAIQNGL